MLISIPVRWLALIFIELLTKRKSECRNLDLCVAKVTWVYASGPLMMKAQKQWAGMLGCTEKEEGPMGLVLILGIRGVDESWQPPGLRPGAGLALQL